VRNFESLYIAILPIKLLAQWLEEEERIGLILKVLMLVRLRYVETAT
jgi:hypothetical protein